MADADDQSIASERRADLARRLGNDDWDDQLAFLNDPVVRDLMAASGIDTADLDALYQDAAGDLDTLALAAEICGPIGWAVSGHHLRATDYRAVVEAWDAGKGAEGVDAILAAAWRDRRGLRRTYGPMFPLGKDRDPDDVFDILHARKRLLDKAVDFHLTGEYEAAILIVLTQVDGLCYDWTGEGFFPARDDQLVDDQTIAGLPTVLGTVRRVITRDVRRSSLGSGLARHAVIHGRSLGYGTEANSARCFALLAGVVDWLRAREDAKGAVAT